MRKIRNQALLLSVFLLCGLITGSVLAGDWETFQKVSARYYYLDDQDFSRVTCRIDVPLIERSLKQIRAQLLPFQSNISIEENVNDFLLTFDRVSGLTFVRPTVDVKITSMEGIADPERAESGVEKMKNGFRMAVDGTVTSLQGLFEYYRRPNKETFRLTHISGTKDPVRMSYEQGGNSGEATIDGATRHTVLRGRNMVVDSIEKFITLNNRYVVESVDSSVKQPSRNISGRVQVKYQDIDGISFPKKFTTESRVEMNSIKMENMIEISLSDCQVQ